MRVLRPFAHSATTSPPRPPSPPSGPPNSMNFSRRNETQPAPPSPERMYTRAWSRNFMGVFPDDRSGLGGQRGAPCVPGFASEAKAVAWHHGAARRRALEAGRHIFEARLLQNTARGGIFDTGAGDDLDSGGHDEGGFDHRLDRLAGQPLAPGFRGKRIAE